MKTRFILFSKENGIYLGSCMGLGFWSLLDPVGQDSACTFSSEQEALDWVNTWETKPNIFWSLEAIEVQCEGDYITRDECIRNGFPGWEIDENLRN